MTSASRPWASIRCRRASKTAAEPGTSGGKEEEEEEDDMVSRCVYLCVCWECGDGARLGSA